MIGWIIGIWVGSVLSNFSYQLFRNKPMWGEAIERSYFQSIPLLVLTIVSL